MADSLSTRTVYGRGPNGKGFRQRRPVGSLHPTYSRVRHRLLRGVSAGGAVTPMSPTHTVAELRYQLNDSGARFLMRSTCFRLPPGLPFRPRWSTSL